MLTTISQGTLYIWLCPQKLGHLAQEPLFHPGARYVWEHPVRGPDAGALASPADPLLAVSPSLQVAEVRKNKGRKGRKRLSLPGKSSKRGWMRPTGILVVIHGEDWVAQCW